MISVSRGIGNMASWIGAGGVGLSGKKTVSKLEEGDVGHWGASWWQRFGSKGEEVLGEFSMLDLGRSWHGLPELRHKLSGLRHRFSEVVSWWWLTWVSPERDSWFELVTLIWLSLLLSWLLSALSKTCQWFGGSLEARRPLLTLWSVLAEVRAMSSKSTWLGDSDKLNHWLLDREDGGLGLDCWVFSRDDDSCIRSWQLRSGQSHWSSSHFLILGLTVVFWSWRRFSLAVSGSVLMYWLLRAMISAGMYCKSEIIDRSWSISSASIFLNLNTKMLVLIYSMAFNGSTPWFPN